MAVHVLSKAEILINTSIQAMYTYMYSFVYYLFLHIFSVIYTNVLSSITLISFNLSM